MADFQEITVDINSLPVHPAADIFPMLSDAELRDLAADIKANGLLNPLIISPIDGVMTLIDGRNRRAACKLAGVEPTYREVEGNPNDIIWSLNVARRNLSQGQMAIIAAMMFPDAEKGGRGKKSEGTSSAIARFGVSAAFLSMARKVLRTDRALAEQVRTGDITLKAAHQQITAAANPSPVKTLPDGEEKPFTGEELSDTDELKALKLVFGKLVASLRKNDADKASLHLDKLTDMVRGWAA